MTPTSSAAERLPWLTEDAPPPAAVRKPRRSGAVLFVAGAASATVAFGVWSFSQQAGDLAPTTAVVRTVSLPAPSVSSELDGAPAVPSAAEREALRPEAAPGVVRARAIVSPPRVQPRSQPERNPTIGSANQADASQNGAQAIASVPVAAASSPALSTIGQPPQLWPARDTVGAGGRLVQIGAFGSRQQAKLGWRRMQRSYPAVAGLPAVVVPSRNSKGRKFYRFQIGTTSHAHSEVLCQRMQRIDFSCAVIGLPWKAKLER